MLHNLHIDCQSGNTVSWSKEYDKTCFKEKNSTFEINSPELHDTEASSPTEEDQFPDISSVPSSCLI